MIQRYGLKAFAETMSEFATGERYVNRIWSASADGYMDEARRCIDRNSHHLSKAQELLQQYGKSKAA